MIYGKNRNNKRFCFAKRNTYWMYTVGNSCWEWDYDCDAVSGGHAMILLIINSIVLQNQGADYKNILRLIPYFWWRWQWYRV